MKVRPHEEARHQMTNPSSTTPPNHYETLDELKRLLAEADDDFANGRFRTFQNNDELWSLFEEIKARGRTRLDAERRQSTATDNGNNVV